MKVIVSILAIIILVLSYLLISKNNIGQESSTKELSQYNQLLNEEIQLKNKEVAALKQQLKEFNKEALLRKKLSGTIVTPSDIKVEVLESSIEENNSVKSEQMTKLIAQLKSNPKLNFDQVVQSQFEQEETDYEWASRHENNLVNLFSKNPSLAHLPLEQVQCRTNVCKISIFQDDSSPFNIATDLSTALGNETWHNPNALFIFDHKPVDGRYILYIGRYENSISL